MHDMVSWFLRQVHKRECIYISCHKWQPLLCWSKESFLYDCKQSGDLHSHEYCRMDYDGSWKRRHWWSLSFRYCRISLRELLGRNARLSGSVAVCTGLPGVTHRMARVEPVLFGVWFCRPHNHAVLPDVQGCVSIDRCESVCTKGIERLPEKIWRRIQTR